MFLEKFVYLSVCACNNCKRNILDLSGEFMSVEPEQSKKKLNIGKGPYSG